MSLMKLTNVSAKVGTLLSAQLGKLMGPGQANWNQAVQRRIAVTSAVLQSIKGIKLMGLTKLSSDKIQSLRVSELELSKVFRKLIVWMNLNCQSSYLMSLVCLDKWLTT